jgi:3'-phosphoadenosine 5'-phosphosulfate sulfotransferase
MIWETKVRLRKKARACPNAIAWLGGYGRKEEKVGGDRKTQGELTKIHFYIKV